MVGIMSDYKYNLLLKYTEIFFGLSIICFIVGLLITMDSIGSSKLYYNTAVDISPSIGYGFTGLSIFILGCFCLLISVYCRIKSFDYDESKNYNKSNTTNESKLINVK